jgi:hypothetical protein
LVLLLELLTLNIGVLFDLLHSFFVIVEHYLDFGFELLNLVFLDLDKVVVLLLRFINFNSMFFEKFSLLSLESPCLFFFLAL